MCGRYDLIDGQRVYSRSRVAQPMLPMADNGNVRPTQPVFALQTDHALSLMKWGLVPMWAKDPNVGSKMINARAEGIENKPSFKKPLRDQRCIIPASAFFEFIWTRVPKLAIHTPSPLTSHLSPLTSHLSPLTSFQSSSL
jgi:putative SOS response-associated peptidase YedK